MIVYRFEKKGIGPYVGGLRHKLYRDIKTRTYKKSQQFLISELRTSKYDRAIRWSIAHSDKKYIFGCTSKQHLRAYFGGDFKPLFKAGYRIKRYKVPDDEVLHMVMEVAFPVKYHKLQTVAGIKKRLTSPV